MGMRTAESGGQKAEASVWVEGQWMEVEEWALDASHSLKF